MINQALEHYDFNGPTAEFLRHSESMTYKVTDGEKSYVLRIHKPMEGFDVGYMRMGKTQAQQIASEIELLQFLYAKGNLATQAVIPNKHGNTVTLLDDCTPVTVLEWIEGETLSSIEITDEIAKKIGTMIGQLHTDVAGVTIKNRFNYDCALLSRMIEEADNAYIQGHFSEKHTRIMKDTLQYIRDYFVSIDRDFILVHSDLDKSNLVWSNGRVIPIDFSLSGYCIPEMDLASVFAIFNDKALNPHILNGYQSVCSYVPDDNGIAACFCFGILLFLTSQHSKIAGEPWLNSKMDGWCNNQFLPLLDGSVL